jgi:hypothetical protein
MDRSTDAAPDPDLPGAICSPANTCKLGILPSHPIIELWQKRQVGVVASRWQMLQFKMELPHWLWITLGG